VEAAIYLWRRRSNHRSTPNPNRSTTKSSWGMVKDFMLDGDKRELLAQRAENILTSLKHRFPGLTQTTLDTSKIQCNKVPILYKLYIVLFHDQSYDLFNIDTFY